MYVTRYRSSNWTLSTSAVLLFSLHLSKVFCIYLMLTAVAVSILFINLSSVFCLFTQNEFSVRSYSGRILTKVVLQFLISEVLMVRRRFAVVVRYWWREAIWCTSAARRCSCQFLRSLGPGVMAHCSQFWVSCWGYFLPLQPVLVILAGGWVPGVMERCSGQLWGWFCEFLGWCWDVAEMVLGSGFPQYVPKICYS